MSTNKKYVLPESPVRSRISACALGLVIVIPNLTQADPEFSEWSTPLPTVSGGCPIETRDGNWLFTASSSAGTRDIWVYRRNGRGDEFSDRTMIGEPISLGDAEDFCPTPLPGNWLMFVSDRLIAGACGNTDIYLARHNANTARSPEPAKNLGCDPGGPNTTGREMSPSLVTTSEGTFLYYSTNVGGDHDIYRSTMAPDGSFGSGAPVASLNTVANDQQPNVSRDGLTIVFASDRDGGSMDVYMSMRDSLADDWSVPRNLSDELAFPTAGIGESRPSLSWDLKRLYYGAGGVIYRSTRQPAPKSN